jgi:hypothetical protein
MLESQAAYIRNLPKYEEERAKVNAQIFADKKARKAWPLDKRLGKFTMSTGIWYADRGVEVNGNYKQLAYLLFSTLELCFYPACPEEFRPLIKAHAAELQARRGEEYIVPGTGQTITLGGKLNDAY